MGSQQSARSWMVVVHLRHRHRGDPRLPLLGRRRSKGRMLRDCLTTCRLRGCICRIHRSGPCCTTVSSLPGLRRSASGAGPLAARPPRHYSATDRIYDPTTAQIRRARHNGALRLRMRLGCLTSSIGGLASLRAHSRQPRRLRRMMRIGQLPMQLRVRHRKLCHRRAGRQVLRGIALIALQLLQLLISSIRRVTLLRR